MNDRFLKACRRESVDATPVWLMRQAGRYMPEYMALREKYTMLERIRTPQLACEITMQPINAFELDAAIIFADILPLLMGMGLDLDFVAGEGPQIFNPIASPADVEKLRTPPAEENAPFTIEAVRITRKELNNRVPLIGFSGAPFTLASYAIEGGGSKNYVKAKSFMYGESEAWHLLMKKLTEVITGYLIAQAEAGAQAVQIFDSWAGALSPFDYRAYVLPYNKQIVEQVKAKTDVPVIYFGTDMSGMLDTVREIPAHVLGMDWRIPIDTGWNQVGGEFAVQGNLDPVTLFAPWPVIQKRVDGILERVGNRTGHIFNLGHGILPKTPMDNVKRLAEYVHEKSAEIRR